MRAQTYRLTGEQLAASIYGCGHVAVGDSGVTPAHFTRWVTDRVMSPTFTAVASAAGGARLRLETPASRIWITFTAQRITYATDAPAAPFVAISDGVEWPHAAISPHVGLVLVVEADGSIVERVGHSGSVVLQRPAHTLGAAVDIYLPTDAAVTIDSVRADAPIEVRKLAPRRRWVHHGSSISQGGVLGNPRYPWPVQAARTLDVELVNASLPGNCLLDACVAEELAGLDADVVSLELGINVANWDSHIARTFVPAVHHLLDQFFRVDPTRPVIVISPMYCEMYEHHGGSLQMDAAGTLYPAATPRAEALNLTDIRGLLQRVIDSRPLGSVILIDGRSLLGPDEQKLLSDGLHPDLAGATLIAERFAALCAEPNGPLHAAFYRETVAADRARTRADVDIETKSKGCQWV